MERAEQFEDFDRPPRGGRDLDEIAGDLDALWREWRRLQGQALPRGNQEDVDPS